MPNWKSSTSEKYAQVAHRALERRRNWSKKKLRTRTFTLCLRRMLNQLMVPHKTSTHIQADLCFVECSYRKSTMRFLLRVLHGFLFMQ